MSTRGYSGERAECHFARLPSPAGWLEIVWARGAVVRCGFVDGPDEAAAVPASGDLPAAVRRAFGRYLRGETSALDTVPVALRGTDFDQRVWRELRKIPAGTTTTYGAIARRLRMPGAARAV